MFETKGQNGALIERLYEACEGLGRGDVLTHEVIREILGCEPHEGHWGHCVTKVRRRLLEERGIDCWPDPTVGYRLMTAEEQLVDAPRRRQLRGFRQLRRNVRSLTALPDRNLTAHQRRMKLLLVEAARQGAATIRREMREQAQVVRATPVNPRRPILVNPPPPLVRPND